MAGVHNLGNYQIHKMQMEDLVRKGKHLIIRLPNLVGNGANPVTLVEFLSRKVQTGSRFTVQTEAKRSVIDVSHVASMVDLLVKKDSFGKTINLVNPITYSIMEIVYLLEDIYKRNAEIILKSGGENFECESTDTLKLANQLGIEFNENYLDSLLRKYYE
jgi:nucleoside-diphosphate-sugar epimerase